MNFFLVHLSVRGTGRGRMSAELQRIPSDSEYLEYNTIFNRLKNEMHR